MSLLHLEASSLSFLGLAKKDSLFISSSDLHTHLCAGGDGAPLLWLMPQSRAPAGGLQEEVFNEVAVAGAHAVYS